jgi:hypothetical protein
VILEQNDIPVDRVIQSQPTNQLVHGPNAPTADRTRSLGDLVVDVGIFEHRVGLVWVLLPFQSGFKILLVSEVDFVVSFVHLECAPFGGIGFCKFLLQPITTHIPGLFHYFSQKSRRFRG